MDKFTDGLKHDGGKLRLSLVPAEAIEAIGAVMTHGAEKYGEASYKQVDPKRYRDALMRHICKWLKDPCGVDDDSGLPHLWHIITNAAFLCELDTIERKHRRTDFDTMLALGVYDLSKAAINKAAINKAPTITEGKE